MVSFSPRCFTPRQRGLWNPLNRKLVWTTAGLEALEKTKISSHYWKYIPPPSPKVIQPTAYSPYQVTYPGSPPYQVSSKSVMLSEFCYKQLDGQGHTTQRCIFFIMPKTEHCGYKAQAKRGNLGEYGTKIQRKIMRVCQNITYFRVCVRTYSWQLW